MRTIFFLVLLLHMNVLFAQKPGPPTTVVQDTSSTVFEKIEVEASVDRQEWIDHLTKNLQSVVEKAARKGMKPGTYTVLVKFLVEKDGSLSDVHALNDPGYGLAKGAEKVVSTGPKWQAGEQNGKKVRSYHTQPITVVIQK
jgi:protein TonB